MIEIQITIALFWLACGTAARCMLKHYWVNRFGEHIGWTKDDQWSGVFLIVAGLSSLIGIALFLNGVRHDNIPLGWRW